MKFILKRFIHMLPSRLAVWIKNPYQRGVSGHIDGVYFGCLRGWAKAEDRASMTLVVKKNNVPIGTCRANQARADLVTKGIGDGRYGFALSLPPDFTVCQGDIIEVVDAEAPSRGIAVRITTRMAQRPGWRYPDVKSGEERSKLKKNVGEAARSFNRDIQIGNDRYSDWDLAAAYEKVVIQNRDLRTTVARYQAEIQFNRLQLRQVQEELEYWYLNYLALRETGESIPKDT